MSTVSTSRGDVAVILLFMGIIVIGIGAVPQTSANHQPDRTDFTFEPMEPADRRPGAEDVRVGTIGASTGDVDTGFETLLEMRAVYSEGSWADCGPGSSEVFGIDRGGDNEPYEVDESLSDNVKRFSVDEDVFETEFYDEDDLGASTHLNPADRTMSIIECVDNPDEPGWYQIDNASVTGRTPEGEVRTYSAASHFFWICECDSDREARAQLGPPPSEAERTPVPTPTPTAAPTPTGHGTDSGIAATATATDTGDGNTGVSETTPTPTASATVSATAPATSTPSATAGDWDAYRLATPTRGDGAGVGPVAAVLSLLAAARLIRREK